jgi:hypothetical protein
MVSINRWFLFLQPILFDGWELDMRSYGLGDGMVKGISRASYWPANDLARF